MPRRAIISIVSVLIGTLSGVAAPLNPAARNATFQPRSGAKLAVLRPAQARIMDGTPHRTATKARSPALIGQAPGQIKLNHTAFNRSDGATVRFAVVQAAGGN